MITNEKFHELAYGSTLIELILCVLLSEDFVNPSNYMKEGAISLDYTLSNYEKALFTCMQRFFKISGEMETIASITNGEQMNDAIRQMNFASQNYNACRHLLWCEYQKRFPHLEPLNLSVGSNFQLFV